MLSFLRALKLPLKLLAGFFGKKSKREKSELEKKQFAYVRNFSPKHYSWQKNSEKKKKPFGEKSRQNQAKNGFNTKLPSS